MLRCNPQKHSLFCGLSPLICRGRGCWLNCAFHYVHTHGSDPLSGRLPNKSPFGKSAGTSFSGSYVVVGLMPGRPRYLRVSFLILINHNQPRGASCSNGFWSLRCSWDLGCWVPAILRSHWLIANNLVRDLNLRPLRLCPIRTQNIAWVRSYFVPCLRGRMKRRRYPAIAYQWR